MTELLEKRIETEIAEAAALLKSDMNELDQLLFLDQAEKVGYLMDALELVGGNATRFKCAMIPILIEGMDHLKPPDE